MVKRVGAVVIGVGAIVIGVGAIVIGVGAQEAPRAQRDADVRFAAASIKPTSTPATSGPPVPGIYNRPFSTLQQLIVEAYDLPAYRIVGGAGWTTTDRFAVLAKADAGVPRARMRAMVRQLLEERFQLRTHHESRELPIYNLVFSRADHRLGPGLRPAPVDCTPFRSGQRPMEESPTVSGVDGRVIARCAFTMTWDMRTGATKRNLNGMTLPEFVAVLEGETSRDVHDQTGLTGVFDFDLTFVPANPVAAPGSPRPNGDGPALTTALQEQLGLKLESARGPVEVLVIDAVTRPTPD